MLAQKINIVRKNFSYLLTAETAIRGMMLILTIFLARVYGTEKFGVYALALSVGNLFEIIFNLGLGIVFMQRVAGHQEKTTSELRVFLPLRILLSIIGFSCFVLFALALQKNAETFYSLILAGLYFSLFSIEMFLWNCFDARQKMHFTAAIKFLKFFIIFALGIYFIFVEKPVFYMMYAYLAGVSVSILMTVWLIIRYFSRLGFEINISAWRKIISEGWPIALSGAFIFIYNSLDTIIISVVSGEKQVGLYQVSYKIIGTIFILSTLINQSYLPALVKSIGEKREHMSAATGEIFSRAIRSVFFWSIPITAGGLLLAERIILFVFGNEYLAGVNAFRILIFNCLIFFLSSAITNFLYACRKQKSTMKIFFFGAAANVAFNIFMIPAYGIEGAAATTILAELVVLMGIYLLARKIIRLNIFAHAWIPLLASLVMGGSLYFIKAESLILTVLIGGAVYMGAYYLLFALLKPGTNGLQIGTSETGNESLPRDLP